MQWSGDSLLKFTKTKCKLLHIVQETGAKYTMNNEIITETNKEKDLGITIDNKLDFQEHIHIQVRKANQKLGLLNI